MEKHLKINISAGAVLLLAALYFILDWDGLAALLLAAAAHEAGHLAALRVMGGRVTSFRFDICGAVIERRGAPGTLAEAACAAAGPPLSPPGSARTLAPGCLHSPPGSALS